MADLPTLQGRLDALKQALASGRSQVSYAGRTTIYKSNADILLAIKNVESDIAKSNGASMRRTYLFSTCKDL